MHLFYQRIGMHGWIISKKTAHAIAEVKGMKHYPDLYALMRNDAQAQHYFQSLPDYVREQMETRAGSVNSLESMKDYAENLLRGDD